MFMPVITFKTYLLHQSKTSNMRTVIRSMSSKVISHFFLINLERYKSIACVIFVTLISHSVKSVINTKTSLTNLCISNAVFYLYFLLFKSFLYYFLALTKLQTKVFIVRNPYAFKGIYFDAKWCI